MLRSAFLILLLSSSIACVTSRPRVPVCLADPEHDLMHCDGVSQTWKGSRGMVCLEPDDFAELNRRCR
jgi:hypothetical protein